MRIVMSLTAKIRVAQEKRLSIVERVVNSKGLRPSSSRLPGQQAETAVRSCEGVGDEESDKSNS